MPARKNQKYKETGARRLARFAQTVKKMGFDTEQEMVDTITKLSEDGVPASLMAKQFGVGAGTILGIQKRHNIQKKSHKELVEAGVRDKYGVDNVMDDPEIQQRQRDNQMKALEREDNWITKGRRTLKERTGFEFALQVPEYMEKRTQTMLDEFGVEHYAQIPGVSKLLYDATKENNGGVHPMDTTGWNRSSGEQEILDNILSIIPSIQHETNNRKCLPSGKELDLYFPDKNVAIEYCGEYWHSESGSITSMRKKFQREVTPEEEKTCRRIAKHRHKEKQKEAKSVGIQLLTIWEHEWRTRPSQVMNFVCSVLGLSNVKIYARKCTVVEIDKKDAVEFINNNHIQPIHKHNVKRAFGLLYEGNLVSVMTFSMHHRNNKSWVLNRFCSDQFTTIAGGASKLFKHAQQTIGFDECISWSDNRISWGNVYEKLGFDFDEELGPDYFYLTNKGILAKQSATRDKLDAREGQTEFERATELGYHRVWDCGKIRWVWQNK